MPFTVPQAVIRRTEGWLVRRGAPTMIEGYGFVDHVLPRMLPSLAFVALASLAWLVPLRSAGSHGWILLGGVAVMTLAAWGTSTVLVRRLPRFSRRAAIAFLAAYATMPVAVPLLQLAVDGAVTPPGGNVVGLLGFVIFFAAAFVATLLATTYGLGTLLRRAVRHSVFDLRNSVHLLGRALPALLFVTLFLFFTGELWQAMNRLAWWRVVLVVVLFAAITVLAAAARLRDEIGRVEQDLSRPTLAAACRDTPLAGVRVEQLAPDGQLPAMPRTRWPRRCTVTRPAAPRRNTTSSGATSRTPPRGKLFPAEDRDRAAARRWRICVPRSPAARTTRGWRGSYAGSAPGERSSRRCGTPTTSPYAAPTSSASCIRSSARWSWTARY